MDNVYYPQTDLIFIDRSVPSRTLPDGLKDISVSWSKDENYVSVVFNKGMADIKARLFKAELKELEKFYAPLADAILYSPVVNGDAEPLHALLDRLDGADDLPEL